MPEAAAQLTKPVDEPIRIDDSLNQIRQSVGANADQAIGNKGPVHNPIPFAEREIPIHVPSGVTVNTNNNETIDIPQTHKPNKTLDNLSHLVNLGGEENAAPRVSDTAELKQAIEKRNLGAMNARNNPSSGEGIIRNIKDWFYDEDKKAA